MGALILGDAWAAIRYAQESRAGQGDGDLRPSGGMADGVLDEIAGDFRDRLLGGQNRYRFAVDVECEGNACRGCQVRKRLCSPPHDSCRIQTLPAGTIGTLQTS